MPPYQGFQGYFCTEGIVSAEAKDRPKLTMPQDNFARSCFADFLRKQGKKKLRGDIEIHFPTTLGAI